MASYARELTPAVRVQNLHRSFNEAGGVLNGLDRGRLDAAAAGRLRRHIRLGHHIVDNSKSLQILRGKLQYSRGFLHFGLILPQNRRAPFW